MTTLSTLYQAEGHQLLDRLHEATGANRVYLYQIASGRRRPSFDLAKLLATAEPRLDITAMLEKKNSKWHRIAEALL